MKKLSFLREKHPRFIYRSYSYKLTGNYLKIVFDFLIEPDIRFKPELIIRNIPKSRLKKIGDRVLNNFVFHLGLMEIPTYWKATCSKEIIIKAGYLNKEQIQWWHDLLIKGMGQFFYENKIDYRGPEFLKITAKPRMKTSKTTITSFKLRDRYLVPFAGGRDSIVTLEKLKEQKREIALFSVNPIKQVQKTAKVSSIKNQIVIKRKIDKRLLDLNKKGYLNGHTPFTALLSFLSVFCAVLFNYKNIAFSNEKSANEGNVKYLGKIINHQWAKSSEFEKKFKSYYQKYLIKNINYFNYVRRYSELEISKMFTKYSKYFSVFSSCNANMKIKPSVKSRWCGDCPKCLFVYASLCPFLEKKQLWQIFKKNLFEKKELLPIMKALIGQGRHKPFECVGTYKESRLAFNLSFKKAKKSGKVPYLLQKFNEIR